MHPDGVVLGKSVATPTVLGKSVATPQLERHLEPLSLDLDVICGCSLDSSVFFDLVLTTSCLTISSVCKTPFLLFFLGVCMCVCLLDSARRTPEDRSHPIPSPSTLFSQLETVRSRRNLLSHFRLPSCDPRILFHPNC